MQVRLIKMRCPVKAVSYTHLLSMVNSLPDVYEGEDFINFRRDVELSKDPTKAAQGYFNNPAYMTLSLIHI